MILLNIDEPYLNFDIDAIDKSFASSTDTPDPSDLLPKEVMQILYSITGADMMEITPFTDRSGLDLISRENTLKVAGNTSALLLGKMNK